MYACEVRTDRDKRISGEFQVVSLAKIHAPGVEGETLPQRNMVRMREEHTLHSQTDMIHTDGIKNSGSREGLIVSKVCPS